MLNIAIVKPGEVKRVSIARTDTLTIVADRYLAPIASDCKVTLHRRGRKRIHLFPPIAFPVLLEEGDMITVSPKSFS